MFSGQHATLNPTNALPVIHRPRSNMVGAAGRCCAARTRRPSIRRATRLGMWCSRKPRPCGSGTNWS